MEDRRARRRSSSSSAATVMEVASCDSSALLFDDDQQHRPLIDAAGIVDQPDRSTQFCCCDVWVCALSVSVVELMGLVLAVVAIGAVYGQPEPTFYSRLLIVCLAGAAVGFLIVGMLIHGVLKQNYRLLTPHLIAQTLLIGLAAVGALVFAVRAARIGQSPPTDAASRDESDVEYWRSSAAAVALTLLGAVESLFLAVIYRCYKYLKELGVSPLKPVYMPLVNFSQVQPAV